jgi:hypothetical protein
MVKKKKSRTWAEGTHRLQRLLDLHVQSASLQGGNRRALGLVRDGRAALGAENAPHGVARVGLAGPTLDGAVDGELVLEHDADEG